MSSSSAAASKSFSLQVGDVFEYSPPKSARYKPGDRPSYTITVRKAPTVEEKVGEDGFKFSKMTLEIKSTKSNTTANTYENMHIITYYPPDDDGTPEIIEFQVAPGFVHSTLANIDSRLLQGRRPVNSKRYLTNEKYKEEYETLVVQNRQERSNEIYRILPFPVESIVHLTRKTTSGGRVRKNRRNTKNNRRRQRRRPTKRR